MNLKDQIRIAREAKGYTIAGLAEKLGVSRTAIVWWEEGTHRPSTRRLPVLEKALEVRFDLSERGNAMPMTNDQPSISVQPEILSLAVAIGRLPKAHREAIEVLVRIGETKMRRVLSSEKTEEAIAE
jgi:transcriptional regulator with XRE-family HTH domain